MTGILECIEKLASSDEADRIYAAEDLGFANDAAGIRPLFERLAEESSRAVREAIFSALLQIEDDAVIEGALSLLDSDDSFLRTQAVQLLQILGGRSLPFLDRAFCEGAKDRRKFVIDVIAGLADPRTQELYRRALIDPDLNVVITAVESLGNTRQVAFKEEIERLVSPKSHPMLLGACFEALAKVGNEDSLTAVQACFGKAEALPVYLRASYLKLVGAQGGQNQIHEVAFFAGIEPLDSAVLNALTSLRNRCPDILLPDSLAQPLQEIALRNPPSLAYQAVRLLSGLVRDRQVWDFLLHCLDCQDKVIRIGAIQAMREGGGEPAEVVMRERLAHENDKEVLQVLSGKRTE